MQRENFRHSRMPGDRSAAAPNYVARSVQRMSRTAVNGRDNAPEGVGVSVAKGAKIDGVGYECSRQCAGPALLSVAEGQRL